MKVQNEMSTRISVETVSAIGSLSAFRNAISATSNAWRAQETALKNSGNYSQAVRERISGLNNTMDLQRAKIRALRKEQEGLDASNKKQGGQYYKLEKQISQANKQLASYESQARRARSAAAYQVSGLADLQKSYRAAQSASNAYVGRLNAEGKAASATVARFRGLKSSLTNLESQYRKQEFMLRQVANASGKDSDAYRKQKEQLDKTATSIIKTKDEMKGMQSEVSKLQPTGFRRIDNAVVNIENHTSRLRTRMSSAFDSIKNHAMTVAASVGTITVGLVNSARKAANVQKTMVENQNLMTTAGEKSRDVQGEVNKMYSDGEKYSVQYGYSQRTIAQGYQELIKRGYDGRQSIGAMKSILEAARASGDSFDDTMKVTTSTLEAFGMRSETTAGMMRNTAKAADVLAKGADVTSTSFKSIGEAMTYAGSSAKASGVSLRETTAILGVLSNNGLEATQAGTGLQRILSRLAAPTDTAKASLKKYNISIDDFKDKSGKLKPISGIFQDINKHVPKAERLEFFNKVFGQTAQNAASILSRTAGLNRENSQSLQHVEDQLKTAYSEDYVGKLARRNMNSAKNSQDRFKYASEAIQIEIGRNMLPAISRASQSMANAFGRKDTQRGLKVIARGIGNVASAVVSLVTLMGRHTTTVKVFGGALLAAFGSFKLLEGIGKLRSALTSFPALLRGVATAARVATLGFNPWVIAIEAVVAAFALLYTHSKKFRKFVNGLVKDAGKAMKGVGRWFSRTFKSIGKSMADSNKRQAKLQKEQQRQWDESNRKIQRSVSQMWSRVKRSTSNGWNTLKRDARNGLRDSQRTWNTMSRNVQRTSRNMWNRASRDARNGWNYVARWGNRSSKDVARTWNWMNRETNQASRQMFRNHERTFRSGYKVLQDQTNTWRDVTTGHWDRLANDTKQTAQDMNRFHQRLFRDMYNKLNDMTNGRLGDMLKTWQNIFGSIQDAVSNAVGTVHRRFVDLVKGVLSPFKTMIDDIKGGINWILDKLGASKIGGDFSISMPGYANGTKDTHPGGLAKVNDGLTSHYREMYRLPNGELGMFPAKRNMIVPLPKGTSVLDGERSYTLMRMMGVIPHYADGVGALSDMFSNIVNKAGDAMDDMVEDVDKILSHPIEFAESVFKKFVKVSTPIKFASTLVTAVPKYIAKQMGNWIKKQFQELANPGGSGVERWRPYVIRALKMNGFEASAYQVAAWMKVIQRESNGNPLAVNHWDSNARAGHPSKGLVQTIDSTFNANAFPGHHNIFNGFDDLLAGIHYMAARYGRGPGAFARVSGPMGYANGGLVDRHQLIEIAEGNKPEYVIPTDINKRSRAYQLLGEIIARFHADEPAQAHINGGYGKKIDQLNAKFDILLDMFGQLLGATDNQTQAIQAQGSLDTKQLYKKMARDKAMRRFS